MRGWLLRVVRNLAEDQLSSFRRNGTQSRKRRTESLVRSPAECSNVPNSGPAAAVGACRTSAPDREILTCANSIIRFHKSPKCFNISAAPHMRLSRARHRLAGAGQMVLGMRKIPGNLARGGLVQEITRAHPANSREHCLQFKGTGVLSVSRSL